jgi:superfamily II DNA or RNA helicase
MAKHGPGTFEYLEAKIRRDATGTLFGRDFEAICQWYLQNEPLYRGKFRRIWRWNEWPDRWGPDCGIDLIAETTDGKLWAVQAKAVSPLHTINKAEIDSFLAESNRREIAFRILIGTTDRIGPKARRTIDEQHKRASVVLRGDLVSAGLRWPNRVGGKTPTPKKAKPRPHQRKAIRDVLRGFKTSKRGRLIKACGTGKTLTGLWVAEALKSRRTLLLVPSISLIQQNLREWGRHARDDFDCLVVCSDQSVASGGDPAMRYTAELGIDVTTDPQVIATFLAARRRRPAVVFSTYHSSDRVSIGQKRAKKTFDLTICDEAHRLVGHVDSKFATILDDKKIRSEKRLFMTATPRYFSQRALERAADDELQVVSMDDVDQFGPEFHVLNFHHAITAKPAPLLTEYQVVVIGVTQAEAAKWVREGKLVRTMDGMETDARSLAAQIGLAKAMRRYDLRRVITFHRSIRRASRFVDANQLDSLPSVIDRLSSRSRPSGRLWARHISSETPASKRASRLRALADLPPGTRGLISNCACLGEGVDVPALDGIAFIDPKGSIVDIIQAVGRVIRLSPDKAIGTIVIPVFIDQSEDADYALEQSVFRPVWQVLKALRAHDQRLADELDSLRTQVGSQRGRRICLPPQVRLEIPSLLLKDFEQAFYLRAVQASSEKPRISLEQILAWADEHYAKHSVWPCQTSGTIPGTLETWAGINHALERGHRGLNVSGYSIAKILQEHRGVRNRGDLPDLTEELVIGYADAYFAANKTWPKRDSGAIPGTPDTWAAICVALRNGSRGLKTKTSLADLLWRERKVPNKANRPELTEEQVLEWADQHHSKTGSWPNQTSGAIEGTTETWLGVNAALNKGLRGFDGGSSVIQLLIDSGRLPKRDWDDTITHEQILKWCDAFYQLHGSWPKRSDGDVPDTHYTWLTVDNQLRAGWPASPTKSSLPQLLHKHRDYRHRHLLPPLRPRQIKQWAREYYDREGKWPTTTSGPIPGTTNTWQTVNAALVQGQRQLPGGDSLPRFLHRELGVRHRLASPRLSIKRILRWADLHKEKFGVFPSVHDERSPAEGETWLAINAALERGNRGLGSAGGISLAGLLAKSGRVARGIHKPPLTLATVLRWARAHHRSTGSWPTQSSGAIAGTLERWDNIAQCVRLGLRKFPKGHTLKKLIDKHCRSASRAR